jgi:hypothetical protein
MDEMIISHALKAKSMAAWAPAFAGVAMFLDAISQLLRG